MPDSLEAALVFAVIIVPGYQLVRGYAVALGADAPEKDLYVLAQAVVASLAWLVVTWVVVDDLLGWINDDQVSDHLVESAFIAPLIVGVPYLAGRLAGLGILAVTRPTNPRGPAWAPRLVSAMGLTGRDTTWDRVWLKAIAAGNAVVTVTLDDGRSITGQFAGDSEVATSPALPAVYFERGYEVRDDGSLLTYEGGIHIDGQRIVALKLNQLG